MINNFKNAAAGLLLLVAAAAEAQPAQQAPAYQAPGPIPIMSQAQPMGQMMGQSTPMMSDPQMRRQMAEMAQQCGRMMSDMRPMMRGDRRR